MDLATVLGIVVGLGMVVFTIFHAEGIKGFAPFMNAEAFMIVLGGTFCALLVNYPISQVLGMFKVLKKVMSNYTVDTQEIVTTFVKFAKKARTDGFLALQDDVKATRDDF